MVTPSKAEPASPLQYAVTGSVTSLIAPSSRAIPISIDVTDLDIENIWNRTSSPAKHPGYDSWTISPPCSTTKEVVFVRVCSSARLRSRPSKP